MALRIYLKKNMFFNIKLAIDTYILEFMLSIYFSSLAGVCATQLQNKR